MRAVEIRRNGSVICTAGFPGATMLSLHLDGDCETAGAGLTVNGMAELEGGHHLHLWWLNHLTIADGDEVTFVLVEAENVTTPAEQTASNSPEHIAEQQEYEKQAALPMVLRKLGRSSAGLVFDVRVKGELCRASLGRREFLSASLLWTDFGNERCRFQVRSFSTDEAMRRSGGKEWLAQPVKLGDKVSVKVYRSLQLVE